MNACMQVVVFRVNTNSALFSLVLYIYCADVVDLVLGLSSYWSLHYLDPKKGQFSTAFVVLYINTKPDFSFLILYI